MQRNVCLHILPHYKADRRSLALSRINMVRLNLHGLKNVKTVVELITECLVEYNNKGLGTRSLKIFLSPHVSLLLNKAFNHYWAHNSLGNTVTTYVVMLLFWVQQTDRANRAVNMAIIQHLCAINSVTRNFPIASPVPRH